MTETPRPPSEPEPADKATKEVNGLAALGMFLALAGMIFLIAVWRFAPFASKGVFTLALLCAILGLIVSAHGVKRAKRIGTGKVIANVGFVLSIVLLIFIVLPPLVIFFVVILGLR